MKWRNDGTNEKCYTMLQRILTCWSWYSDTGSRGSWREPATRPMTFADCCRPAGGSSIWTRFAPAGWSAPRPGGHAYSRMSSDRWPLPWLLHDGRNWGQKEQKKWKRNWLFCSVSSNHLVSPLMWVSKWYKWNKKDMQKKITIITLAVFIQI